jgi:hypothetical protein
LHWPFLHVFLVFKIHDEKRDGLRRLVFH